MRGKQCNESGLRHTQRNDSAVLTSQLCHRKAGVDLQNDPFPGMYISSICHSHVLTMPECQNYNDQVRLRDSAQQSPAQVRTNFLVH